MNESNEIVALLNAGIYEIFIIIIMYHIFQITLHIEKRKLFFILFFMSMFTANMTIIYIQFCETNIQYGSMITKILMITNTLFYIIVLKVLTTLDYLHIFLIDAIAQIIVGVTIFAPYTFVAQLIGEHTHSLINFQPKLKNIIGLIVAILIMSAMIVGVRFLLKKYLADFYKKELKWKGLLWAIIIVFTISGLVTTSGDIYQKDEITFMTSIIMIILSIVILYEVSWWVRRQKEKQIQEKNRILSIENTVMKEYYDTLEYQLERTKKFRHDIEKHMSVINEMTLNKELVDFTEMVEKQYSGLKENQFCINPVMNAILVNKKNQCEENGIELDAKMEKFSFNSIKEMDLIAVISNLFDNAIEECINVASQKEILTKIKFSCKSDEKYLYISMGNTTLKDVGELNGLTDKKDKYAHGVGLLIVKEIVEKYNGLMEKSIVSGVYLVNIKLEN